MNERNSPKMNGRHAFRWLPVILALSLVGSIVPLVLTVVTKHPWRVEFLTTGVLIGVVIVGCLRDRESIARIFVFGGDRTKWIVLAIAVFVGWGLLSAVWAHSPASAWNHTIVWAEYILYFLLFRSWLAGSSNIRVVTATFIWLAVFVSTLCFFDYVSVPDFKSLEPILRVRYAKFAEMLATLVPVVWIAAVYSRNRLKFAVTFLPAIAGWITVMLSLSKGAFLAGIAGFIVMFAGSIFFGERGFRKKLIFTLGVWLFVTVSIQAGFSLFSTVPSTSDLISGKADPTRESSLARVFIWKVGKQMAQDNWLVGVGADNFGDNFYESRARYREQHPRDPSDEIVSDSLIERAHDEPLQVAAELGIVGSILFLIPFAVFVVWLIRTLRLRKFRMSAMFWGSVGGVTAFGISSMVSSFSFRLAQNGIVFFLVFLLALNELRKADRSRSSKPTEKSAGPARYATFAFLAVILTLMMGTSLLKAAAEYYSILGDQAEDTSSALASYGRARLLDPDYTATYLRGASRTFAEKDYRTAAEQMGKAIDEGYGVVLNYSVLAACLTEIGNHEAADTTFLKAIRIYPNSVFLRVRYALFLEDTGRIADAGTQMDEGLRIDSRQAIGWHNLIKKGSVSAFYAAQNDRSIALPAELFPDKAVLMYLDKSPEVVTP